MSAAYALTCGVLWWLPELTDTVSTETERLYTSVHFFLKNAVYITQVAYDFMSRRK